MGNHPKKPVRPRLIAVPKSKQHLPLRLIVGHGYWVRRATMTEARKAFRTAAGVPADMHCSYWAVSNDATVNDFGTLIAKESHRINFNKESDHA